MLSRSKGFSLLEVMIAVLVMSVGLLGLGILVGNSVKVNSSAYTRTQASFLADNIAERMRANTMSTWAGDYTGTYANPTANPGCDSAPCSPTQLANWDLYRWTTMMDQLLPQGSADISCNWSQGFPGWAGLVGLPSLPGTCTVAMSWTESSSDAAAAQQFDLVFHP